MGKSRVFFVQMILPLKYLQHLRVFRRILHPVFENILKIFSLSYLTFSVIFSILTHHELIHYALQTTIKRSLILYGGLKA